MTGAHAGELEVQQRTGRRFPGRIRDRIPPVAAEFLATHHTCVLAGTGADGRVWVTMLCGEAGFMAAADEHTLRVAALPPESDPLHAVATTGGPVGTIIWDATRRMRVNGLLEPAADGFVVHADQVFSNCGRYISGREETHVDQAPGEVEAADRLGSDDVALVQGASTFLIGSRHPDGSADASHRGGNPGFVRVDGPDRLSWPDYDGNNLYMTLGNITLDPRVGLLFLDWRDGTTLQVSGRATIDWDDAANQGRPGSLRVVEMAVDAVRRTPTGVPMRWSEAVLSRHNPC